MPKLNRFLRACVSRGVDFSKISFVREKYHDIWGKYFKTNVPVKFTKMGNNEFTVSGTSSRWVCGTDSGDCEILSVRVTHKGVFVIIGDGCF